MASIRKYAQAIYFVYFYAMFACWLLLFYPLFIILLRVKKNYQWAHWLRKRGCQMVLLLVGMRVQKIYESTHGIPGPCIYAPNHSSFLDIIIGIVAFDHYHHYLGKQELAEIPLFGIFFRSMDIPVNRKTPGGRYKAYIRAKEDLNKGVSLVIFPEGTTSPKAPDLIAFKNGAFKLAVEEQAPLVPVTYLDNWRLLPYDRPWVGRPGKTRVVFHEPLLPGKGEKEADRLKSATYDVMHQKIKGEYPVLLHTEKAIS